MTVTGLMLVVYYISWVIEFVRMDGRQLGGGARLEPISLTTALLVSLYPTVALAIVALVVLAAFLVAQKVYIALSHMPLAIRLILAGTLFIGLVIILYRIEVLIFSPFGGILFGGTTN